MQKNPGCGEVGAFPGFLGAPSGRGGGSPKSRLSKLQVAAGEGKGRAGARRGGGRDKPWICGGKGGIKGEFGGVSGLFFFGLLWWGSGQGALLRGWRGDFGGGMLIEEVISTQSPIAAPHPRGNFKGKRGPGSGTSTVPVPQGQLPALGYHLWGWGNQHRALSHHLQGQDNQHPALATFSRVGILGSCRSTSPRDKGG